MFFYQTSPQNFRKTPTKEFYDGYFTVTVTAFRTKNFFFRVSVYYTYKNIHKTK